MKKKVFSLLAAFLISNVLTTIWYMLTDEANFVPNRRAEINYLALTLNHLLYAGGMVYLFPFYYRVAPQIGRAFLFGIAIAFIMFIPQAMVVRSIWTVDFNTIFILNSIAHLLIGGVMGVAIALISGKEYKGEA